MTIFSLNYKIIINFMLAEEIILPQLLKPSKNEVGGIKLKLISFVTVMKTGHSSFGLLGKNLKSVKLYSTVK